MEPFDAAFLGFYDGRTFLSIRCHFASANAMFHLVEVLILAIVQGIAEFLPISSSGHLVVLNETFRRYGVPLGSETGDFLKLGILLHLGTLLAVLVVFWRRILDMFGKNVRLIPLLIVATIPAGVIGVLIKLHAKGLTESPLVTGCGFLITGFLLLLTIRKPEGEKDYVEMSYLDAFLIGCVQAIAILPGISRSGSTIVAGLFRGLKREDAAIFSFLMAIPTISGAAILEAKDLLPYGDTATDLPGELVAAPLLSPVLLLLGTAVSFVVGLVALLWLMQWLKKGRLSFFAIWVFLMAPAAFLSALNPVAEPLPQEYGPATPIKKAAYDEFAKPLSDKPVEIDLGVLAYQDNEPSVAPESEDRFDPQPLLGDIVAQNSNKETEQNPKNRDNAPGTFSLTSEGEKIEEDVSLISRMTEEERAAAQREVERMIAEERAAQDAAFEKQLADPPLVDEPERLIRLAPEARIWMTPDSKHLVVLGVVSLREGPLELFACRRGSKEYESIVAIAVRPSLIHMGLIAIGAKPGKPVEFHPEFVPPSGETIEVKLRWKDEQGKIQECLAQDWIAQTGQSSEEAEPDGKKILKPKVMETHWVFTGSMEYRDEDDRVHYIADETGELIGVSNFVGAVLDVPIQSSDSNDALMFEPYTERIPELGTAVTLILTAVPDRPEK